MSECRLRLLSQPVVVSLEEIAWDFLAIIPIGDYRMDVRTCSRIKGWPGLGLKLFLGGSRQGMG
jgi:hypothetical protein